MATKKRQPSVADRWISAEEFLTSARAIRTISKPQEAGFKAKMRHEGTWMLEHDVDFLPLLDSYLNTKKRGK